MSGLTSAATRADAARLQVSGFRPPPSQRGMALVITLILLSVSLVMVIAFLAVSKRERASVTTNAELTTARLAADTALAAAQSQILANIFADNSALHNYHLLVSTNYINGYGFVPGLAISPTNVNYDYHFNNNLPVTGAEFPEVVANLLYLPRAPVLVGATAADTNGGRFYLDLNRNGVFEETSDLVSNLVVDASLNTFFDGAISAIGDPQWVGILEHPGTVHAADNKFLSRYAFIALPVGQSLDINAIHNYASSFQDPNMEPGQDSFMRNQGVGSWEINLAAFLTDLNTNQWQPATLLAPIWNYPNNAYNYAAGSAFNSGAAFEDAVSLLRYRYNENYSTLAPAGSVFRNLPPPPNIFGRDNIDIYSDGPLQIAAANINEAFTFPGDNDLQTSVAAWPGSDNVNHFYSLADFFDRNKTQKAKFEYGIPGPGFSDRLSNAVNTVVNNGARPSYDRYTFYRMLDQLGTDSEPEGGKMNLNYDNLSFSGGTIVGAETNLIAWTPLRFFTNAANRLLLTYTTNWFQKNPSNFLATYYGITGYGANYYWTNALTGVITTNDVTGFGLTNIPFAGNINQIPGFGLGNLPVMISNNLIYSPSINRLLQLAANIYDASVNNATTPGGVDYPHVFRPQFFVRDNGDGTTNIFITGYEEVAGVSGIGDLRLSRPKTVGELIPGYSTANYANGVNIYGVPWIIGAKKYLPNFNEFYSFNTFSVTRKLQVRRDSLVDYSTPANQAKFHTNEVFVLSISNHFGCSFWNSYASNYPGGVVSMVIRDWTTSDLSANGVPMSFAGISAVNPQFGFQGFITNISVWPGSGWQSGIRREGQVPNNQSFITEIWSAGFLPESVYPYQGGFRPTSFSFDTTLTSLPVFPNVQLTTANQFQAFLLDGNHVVDYVQFDGPSNVRNLANELAFQDSKNVLESSMWLTNGYVANNPPPTKGVINQIDASKSYPNPLLIPPGTWKSPGNLPTGVYGPDNEAKFFAGFFQPDWTDSKNQKHINTNLSVQVPYTPTRILVLPTIQSANDPLVHYLASDLKTQPTTDAGNKFTSLTNSIAKSGSPYQAPVSTPGLRGLTGRYQPWGHAGQLAGIPGVDVNAFNMAYKDPLVWGSDNWDFPNNPYPSVGWLGRVHRGTPWQSVYLKATNIVNLTTKNNNNVIENTGLNTWLAWLSDTDEFDAINSRPIQDALLFDVFTSAPHPNATRGTLSANQTHLAAWSAVLSGIQVLTNITEAPAADIQPVLTNLRIEPAGLNVVDSPVYQIVNGADGINATRANKNIFPEGTFRRVSDVLRVPALTEKSPFINAPDETDQQKYDVSDEQYEWLPQQMLGLLRVDAAPRYVVYGYGQTLKPAPGGTVLSSSGGNFGLVTNYQVVAESATRSVITVQPQIKTTPNGPVTNYNLRVESFNVLPPE